jgi:hypothetical protein
MAAILKFRVPINSVYQDSIRTLKITSNDYMIILETQPDSTYSDIQKDVPVDFVDGVEIIKNGEKIFFDGNKRKITFSENMTKNNAIVLDSQILKFKIPINSVYQDSVRTLKITSNDYMINFIGPEEGMDLNLKKDTPLPFGILIFLTKNGEKIYTTENNQKITFSENINVSNKITQETRILKFNIPINSTYYDSIRILNIPSNDYMGILLTPLKGMKYNIKKGETIGFFNGLKITKNEEQLYYNGTRHKITFSEDLIISNQVSLETDNVKKENINQPTVETDNAKTENPNQPTADNAKTENPETEDPKTEDPETEDPETEDENYVGATLKMIMPLLPSSSAFLLFLSFLFLLFIIMSPKN